MREREARCASKVFERNLTHAPRGAEFALLPEYVLDGWYDMQLVRTISSIIQRYLNESDRFASARLLACDRWQNSLSPPLSLAATSAV